MDKEKVSIFWFRRDLRFEDNHGLYEALNSSFPVLPIFIFDTNIIDELEFDDPRISFIYEQLVKLNELFKVYSSGLYIVKDSPSNAIAKIINEYDVQGVYSNEDYEPYAKQRDAEIQSFVANHGIKYKAYKDHVIHAKNEVLKADQTPYTVYTPYKNKWMEKFNTQAIEFYNSEKLTNYHKNQLQIPSLNEIGFSKSTIKISDYDLDNLEIYENVRNIPALNQTSKLSPHLRFGTVSIRKVASKVLKNQVFLNELIWREFFIQILYHFPRVVNANFKTKYDNILWRNNGEEFNRWKNGETGYPIIDAGMRELNATGYMHNRVRMITAGFLCKHLLIDWRWGEAYFAQKLLDYELASNNGNWQWSAGTGCDSAPYFRIFNPSEQVKKFDKDLVYIKKWVQELDTLNYSLPMVDHKQARERALRVYKQGIN
jgi:deoxyribodipyrimidine photo-lyase